MTLFCSIGSSILAYMDRGPSVLKKELIMEDWRSVCDNANARGSKLQSYRANQPTVLEFAIAGRLQHRRAEIGIASQRAHVLTRGMHHGNSERVHSRYRPVFSPNHRPRVCCSTHGMAHLTFLIPCV